MPSDYARIEKALGYIAENAGSQPEIGRASCRERV